MLPCLALRAVRDKAALDEVRDAGEVLMQEGVAFSFHLDS